ncbi:MAG: hypothetical protein K8S87_11765, partial [Planctomycetes bacterium]|nr:hypothetical protein [Planctomycetota bacterium]
LSLRRSYNMLPKNTTEIIGAKITDVLGQFYFEVWSAYLQSESITEENQAEVNDLLARALQLSKFVRDQLYEFIMEYIEEYPDLEVYKLLPFYLTAKEIYPDWAPARRWLADYFRATGSQQSWEAEYSALLECTQDEEEWPTLNLECSQTYLLWASYGLRKLQNMQDAEEIKKQIREIQRLFERAHEHNEVFARFSESKFLYWQNRSILYQRWADLLVNINDEENWLLKINVAIESFEKYLSLETIDANNAALASLYRSKFLHLWQKNHAKWYGDYANWEQNSDVSVMLDCIKKYRAWSIKPYENTVSANTGKLAEKKIELEELKITGSDSAISKLESEIAELSNSNDENTKQLQKLEKVNRWLFNYINVLQGIDAQKSGKFDEAVKLFNKSYNAINNPFDAFWLGRLRGKQGNVDSAMRWFLISAEKYPQAFYEIAQILDVKDGELGLDALYLQAYMALTESIRELPQVKDLRVKVEEILTNKGRIEDADRIKLHLAKLDEISVEITLEGSDSSAISLIMAQLNELLNNHIGAFTLYFQASKADSMFNNAVLNAGAALYKSDKFKHLAQIVLSMLKNSLIYIEKNAALLELSEKTEVLLGKIDAEFKNKTFEPSEITATRKMIEQECADSKIPAFDFILAAICRASQDFTKAITFYKSAGSSKLLIFPSYLAIADMLNDIEGKKPEAFKAYKEFLELLKSTGKEHLVEKIPEKSRENYNGILDYFNDKLKTGKNAYEAGNFKAAIENLEECFKFRDDARTAYIIAGAYRKIDDKTNAENWYLRTLHSKEIVLHAYFDLAEMLENVPDRRWRAYWALNKLLVMLEGSNESEVKKLETKARTLLGNLDAIKEKYFAEGSKLFKSGKFEKAHEAFLLSYKTNESPETAYYIGKCLIEAWEHKEDVESVNRKDVEELESAENWFIIAAESEQSRVLGYYDLGTAYKNTVKKDSKTMEFYELFLKKTQISQDAEIKKKRKEVQNYLNAVEGLVESSFEEGKKFYYAKKYEKAYEKFLYNFRHKNSTESALWIGRTLENLKSFDMAQNWYLFASEDLPEAFYELSGMWYRIPIPYVRWLAIKYLDTFIKLSENNDKLKEFREKSVKMKKTLELELAEFTSKPVEIPISEIRGNIWAYDNLYETAEMFLNNPEQKWVADKYFRAFAQLTQVVGKYQDKYEKATEIQKALEKEYSEALKKAFEFVTEKEADKAIAEFVTVLNIKRTFPSDYSMLLALLEQQKRFNELILWSDRAVNFYA